MRSYRMPRWIADKCSRQRSDSTACPLYESHPVEVLIAFLIVFFLLFALRCPTWRTGDYIVMSERDVDANANECPWMPRAEHQDFWIGIERPRCPSLSASMPRSHPVDKEVNETLLNDLSRRLQPGGRWAPSWCNSAHFVAIVVPYRNRQKHLSLFLQHIHPYLQQQNVQYTVFIVEQSGEGAFNRAKLFNVGFVEAMKRDNYCCFFFHDVDLLPEDPRNLYRCERHPRHVSSAIDTFRYVLPYPELFGGVVSMRAEHFTKINGFSNKFFGWGGEDDDMQRRIKHAGLSVVRWPSSISRYTMLEHEKEVPNPDRHTLLDNGENRFELDGLNSLQYRVIQLEERPLYTRILVDIHAPS
ncbi:beta-1,4-N-acetylgalactosaminyltransferase bre-4-like [Ixodes scapularis]|uniref:beta-1,4-N-acetylgalactosaminyltransferase bre-4-like n=1 Tax=Ixodes scapularis TaxID=6945 RepID=UPI001C384AF0|nr:beta-1,4-N-acetylgalactosaminyltransferase bre-4-like [Ixodes scapularis]